MCTIHGLQISHGVPVMLHKHHGVSASQVQTQTPDMGGQQQHVNGGVVVKSEFQWRRKKKIVRNVVLVEAQTDFH